MKIRIRRKAVSLLLAISLLVPLFPGTVPVIAAEADIAAAPVTEAAAKSTAQPENSVFQLDADCQILTYVDEAVFRKGSHIARLPAEETLSSYVFLNEDGSRTVYYMDEAVKFVDSSGYVREKDLTLTAAALGGYTTALNDVHLTLPADPSSGIRILYEGDLISLVPQGGTLSQEMQINGNSVTYPDYFGNERECNYEKVIYSDRVLFSVGVFRVCSQVSEDQF